MISFYVLVLTGALGACFGLATLLWSPKDVREPEVVHGTIPYLTHILGLVKEKTFYCVRISKQTNLPIFTLPLPGMKLYVVCSPKLVLAVQKMPQELAFPPIAAELVIPMTGCGKEAQKIISHNMMGEEGDSGYSPTVHRTIRTAIAPGRKLNETLQPMVGRVCHASNQLAQRAPSTINLADWLRHEVVMATGDAIWGPVHPLQNKLVEEAFWEFENGLYGVLLGFMPSITASGPLKARKTCIDAFYDYFRNMRHEQGSELVKVRYQTSQDYGVSVQDIAKFEVANIIATVVNTFPTVFWMLYYVFSQVEVLSELREELDQVVVTSPLTHGRNKHIIDAGRIKQDCPMLVSVMQETLRHRSISSSFRRVVKDSLLDGQYVLRKGCTVIMPNPLCHFDASVWGDDVAEFDPKRFTRLSGRERAAFRGFGGGHTLCPGRHFATTEILVMTAVLALRFDLTPTDSRGWPPIRTERVKLWSQLTEPEPSIDLYVQQRSCWGSNDEWELRTTDGAEVVKMTVEDEQ